MVSNAALPLFLVYIFLHAASSLSSNAFAPGDISVMVNGMPGKMALETAIVCLDRGYNVMPFGFTGPSEKFSKISVVGKTRSIEVELVKGPGLSVIASNVLQKLKEAYPNLVVIDYTHPSAVLNNLKCYKEENCDFVMGTTGEDAAEVKRIFDEGTNLAVIAPNMAKQIVALHASIISMAKRFPKSFKDYKLTVTESHQSTKADTSGTAKVLFLSLYHTHFFCLSHLPF